MPSRSIWQPLVLLPGAYSSSMATVVSVRHVGISWYRIVFRDKYWVIDLVLAHIFVFIYNTLGVWRVLQRGVGKMVK